jgi:inorganic triphosphatase YgiF
LPASAERNSAAILSGADPLEAMGAGEMVRHAFANSAAFVDGLPVGATVSVGVASDVGVTGDLNALFRQADAALYVAKRAVRNRVEHLGPSDASPLVEVETAVRSARRDSADPFVAFKPQAARVKNPRPPQLGRLRPGMTLTSPIFVAGLASPTSLIVTVRYRLCRPGLVAWGAREPRTIRPLGPITLATRFWSGLAGRASALDSAPVSGVVMPGAPSSQHRPSEIELKLEFDPGDGARIASHPLLRRRKAKEQELVSAYFDTPECTLHKAGVYLRIREIDGRFVQTIKAARSKTELLERLEWEQPVSGRTPELDHAKGTVLEKLLTPKVRASLQLMFETRVRRNTYRIKKNGSEIEAAIDRGEVATRAHTRPISELELELKEGERSELFRLARSFAEAVSLRLEVKTKAERGYELIKDGGLKVEKAAEIAITPDMSAGEAFRAVALNCLRQIVVNEPAMRAGQAEALHQMRIGLRRMRAAIAVFDDVVAGEDLEKIKAELKWITGKLGPARDLDVFADEVLAPLRKSRPADKGIEAAERDVEKRRKATYADAAGAACSDRFRTMLLDLAEWIEMGAWTTDDGKEELRTLSVAEHARKKLRKLRKDIKRKGADLRTLDVAKRHRLRIRAKRLRYATEFFARTFPGAESDKRRSDSLAALKDLQDGLGGLNDLATRHTLIADGLTDEGRDAVRRSSDADLDACGDKAEKLLVDAEKAFARIAAVKPFWKA